ncbi:hypothetical protein G9A89_023846 [Geosiphon pyriformis]|nr:hypothetical protein G9A89_023846 [Geosiphon pyriformis]
MDIKISLDDTWLGQAIATGTETAKEEAQKKSTNGTNLTKLNFLKIPEIWSDKSSKKHSKNAKQSFKQKILRGLELNKSDFTPKNKLALEITENTM